MHLAIFLFCCFPFLMVNTDPIIATTSASTAPTSAPTSAPTETATVNGINVFQNQLNEILVELCASEIDRNKTASAILKFGQIADAKVAVKSVIQFYTENYKENFDNLLLFIGHISSLELQQTAYNTLVEAINAKEINVMNLLSFESFIRTKFDSIDEDNVERKIYQDHLSTIGNHLKQLIVGADLNNVMAFINASATPDRIFELIPAIVEGIDLNNFTDMNRIFEFFMLLPEGNQLKLTKQVLARMRTKTQYRHVFHVICLIRLIGTTKDICSFAELVQALPFDLRYLLNSYNNWQLQKDSKWFLSNERDSSTSRYGTILLSLNSYGPNNGLYFTDDDSLNSTRIFFYDDPKYLSVEYCFHNESFPTLAEPNRNNTAQKSWYLMMSNDLSYVQIKNIYTNEFLIVDDVLEIDASGRHERPRIALSSKCSDCDSSKWSLKLGRVWEDPADRYSEHSCPERKVELSSESSREGSVL